MMTASDVEPDRRTVYLLSNGDILPSKSQALYEYAWSQGIRPLNEADLKPDFMVKKKRKRMDAAA